MCGKCENCQCGSNEKYDDVVEFTDLQREMVRKASYCITSLSQDITFGAQHNEELVNLLFELEEGINKLKKFDSAILF